MLSRLRARLAVVVASLLVVMGALVAAPQPVFAAAIHNQTGEWFYNNVLDEGQKLAYDQILERVQADPSILMDGDDPSRVTITLDESDMKLGDDGYPVSGWLPGIINAFTRDHPEYFWINAGQLAWSQIPEEDSGATQRTYQLEALPGTGADSSKTFIYTGIDEAKLPQMWEDFNTKVDEIIAGAPEDALQALTYFDNWLSVNNTYNSAGMGALNISRCAYSGIMSNNSATDGPVCYGYATALKVLLDRTGIKNAYIEGRAYNGTNGQNGEQHAWNAVEYNNVWYAIDPTWDDPGVSGRPSNQNYFMVGSDTETTPQLAGMTKFSENHVADAVEGLSYPNLNLSSERLSGITPAVAQVILPDGTQQTANTFEEAIQVAVANKGTTIRLWAPVTVGNTVTVPDGTTIDLNSQSASVESFNGTMINNAAIYSRSNMALNIESGSTVTILNENASKIVCVFSRSGSAIENDGTLLIGPFVQLRVPFQGSSPVFPNKPKGVQGAYIAGATSTGITSYEVVRPSNQTASYDASSVAGASVSDLLAHLGDAGSGVVTPKLEYRFNPTSTDIAAPANAPANEWVLISAPDGAGTADTDKLVNGDYTFILRPQGSDATNYYGYTVTLTVSVTVPKTVEELRAEQKQQLNDALATYVEGNYLADDWAAIQSAHQAASDAIDKATDESAMQSIIDNFKTTADAVPTAAERLEVEQQKLKTELEEKFATYGESDYTAENWAKLKAAYEQGLSNIADATTIADAQTALQDALAAMAAIEPKPVDPGTDPEPPVAQVTVTFQSRVPGEDPTTVTVDKGSAVARPTDPVLTGWRFTGWFSDTAYTKEWNFDDPITSDLVLYAGWEEVVSEPAQEPDEPKKPQSNTSQNTQNDTLAKTSDSSIILVPMGLAAAGVAAIAASRKR